MQTLKKLLTKHQKRGRPVVLALLTCIVVVGLATGIVWFNDYLGAKADSSDGFDPLKAYDGEHLDEFVEEMENHFSADGIKGKYGLDLDANGGYLQCTTYDCEKRTLSGTKLTKKMLEEKCDPNDPKSPSKYWFWIKARNYDGGGAANGCDDQVAKVQPISKVANTLTALSNFGRGDWRSGLSLLSSSLKTPRVQAGSYSTWHTEYYWTSTNPLEHKVNAKSGENCVEVPMANLTDGGIIKDKGNSLSGNRKLSFYATDLLPFYKMMTNDSEKWFS